MNPFFFLFVVVLVSAQTDDCRDFNSSALTCTTKISSQNGLYCSFVNLTTTNVCVKKTTGCSPCNTPSNGVCSPICVGSCANPACSDSTCATFLAGWSGGACHRYSFGGFCDQNATCVTTSNTTMSPSCSVVSTTAVAVCGSTACRKSCEPGSVFKSSLVENYCFTYGSGSCPSGQRCDKNGSCVATTICDDIDRISDCNLVVYPGNGRECEAGVAGCNTPVGSVVAPSSQNGCSSASSKLACQSQQCTRNGGNCVWVDFRSSSASPGTCVCPRDCPQCATLVNGECQFNCTVMDGCVTWSCPKVFASNTNCYFPEPKASQVLVGWDETSSACVCHASRPPGCPSGSECDVSGNCGTKTLCSSAMTATTCGQLTCDWDDTVCQWTGTICRCAQAVPPNHAVTALPPSPIPVYSQSPSVSAVGCASAIDCPPLLNVTVFGRGSRMTFNWDCFSEPTTCNGHECVSFNRDAVFVFQLATPATLRGFAGLQWDSQFCTPIVWVGVGNNVFAVVNSKTQHKGDWTAGGTWRIYEFPNFVYGVTTVFLRCANAVDNYLDFYGIRLLGWSDDPSQRLPGWNSTMWKSCSGHGSCSGCVTVESSDPLSLTNDALSAVMFAPTPAPLTTRGTGTPASQTTIRTGTTTSTTFGTTTAGNPTPFPPSPKTTLTSTTRTPTTTPAPKTTLTSTTQTATTTSTPNPTSASTTVSNSAGVSLSVLQFTSVTSASNEEGGDGTDSILIGGVVTAIVLLLVFVGVAFLVGRKCQKRRAPDIPLQPNQSYGVLPNSNHYATDVAVNSPARHYDILSPSEAGHH